MIKKCRISEYVNCWIVKLLNKNYAIMPAHVAFYKKNNMLIKSDFAHKCSRWNNFNLDWKIPQIWYNHMNPSNILEKDIAWAELPDDISNNCVLQKSILSLENTVDGSIDAKFYFHQPYDYSGKIQKTAVLGNICGTVYQSPGSELIETLGIGFKGMSGSIVVDLTGNYIGMMIRRGSDLGVLNLDSSNKVSGASNNYDQSVPIARNFQTRSIIMPHCVIEKHIIDSIKKTPY